MVIATAMRPSITRRDLEGRADAIIETLRAVGANLISNGRNVVEEAAEPLQARGIIVYDRDAFASATATSFVTTPARSNICSSGSGRTH